MPVIGELPLDLLGMFVRNGPNPQWKPIGEYYWFDRDGMLHGWLMTFVDDEGSDTSELVVVNAQDVTAEPVARVIIPQQVPYGFHGTWVAGE